MKNAFFIIIFLGVLYLNFNNSWIKMGKQPITQQLKKQNKKKNAFSKLGKKNRCSYLHAFHVLRWLKITNMKLWHSWHMMCVDCWWGNSYILTYLAHLVYMAVRHGLVVYWLLIESVLFSKNSNHHYNLSFIDVNSVP